MCRSAKEWKYVRSRQLDLQAWTHQIQFSKRLSNTQKPIRDRAASLTARSDLFRYASKKVDGIDFSEEKNVIEEVW